MGRSVGCLMSAAATKARKTGEASVVGASSGGGALAMCTMTWKMERFCACGGCFSASSMAVTPSDHTSTRQSYSVSSPSAFWPVNASGAIQCGVPIIVPRRDIVRCSCAATPRSASLTTASRITSTLAALISRWMARAMVCM